MRPVRRTPPTFSGGIHPFAPRLDQLPPPRIPVGPSVLAPAKCVWGLSTLSRGIPTAGQGAERRDVCASGFRSAMWEQGLGRLGEMRGRQTVPHASEHRGRGHGADRMSWPAVRGRLPDAAPEQVGAGVRAGVRVGSRPVQPVRAESCTSASRCGLSALARAWGRSLTPLRAMGRLPEWASSWRTSYRGNASWRPISHAPSCDRRWPVRGGCAGVEHPLLLVHTGTLTPVNQAPNECRF